MIFLFKRKPIVLDCFTADNSIFTFSKPDYANKFIPDWWKLLPTYSWNSGDLHKKTTAKKCVGIVENFRRGFMFPLWSDLNIEVGAKGSLDYRWQFSDLRSDIQTHPFREIGNVLSETDFLHLKLMSPWSFRCKDDIYWTWQQPTWNTLNNTDYRVLPGTVSYKFQYGANINLMFTRHRETTVVELPFGTPLAHITPISEKPLQIKHHLVTKEEKDKLDSLMTQITFIGKYNAIKNLIRKS